MEGYNKNAVIFVLGNFSCQRYSDYSKLREENFMTYDKGFLAESVASLQEKYVTVLSDLELRSITGHQSEKVFENYIRVSLSEQAQMVGDKILAAKKAKKKKVDK